MSKFRFSFACLAMSTLSGLSIANGQQPASGQRDVPIQQRRSNDGQPPVQTPGQGQVQPGTPANQRPGQVGCDETRRNRSDQQAMTVQDAIVQKLKKANEAEIQLAKLALEKSDNQDVKKLAETLVKDHQECVQKLQQGIGQPQQQDTPRVAGNTVAMVPHELCKIAEKACENSLAMTKEMLTQYEGNDFNMAFLGQQCVAHTMMLAELKAIESDGPKELNEFAKEARNKVQEHLEKCKKLAKQIEKDSDSKS